jgi:hypothetical protein
MERITGEHGFQYYTKRPENCRAGNIHDFVINGVKKVGMEYLVYSELKDQYQVYVVSPGTTGKKIKEYIDLGILYVFH